MIADKFSMSLVSVSTATTYGFNTEPRSYGWALCSVNDQTGELNVVSDWGNWAHRWNVHHLGAPSLTHFIGGRSPGSFNYLADKLTSYEEQHRFCPEKTVAAWRGDVIARRRDGGLDADTARQLWDDLGETASVEHYDDFVARFWDIDNRDALFSDSPSEHIRTEPTGAYRVLLERIIPALVEACSRTVDQRRHAKWTQETIAEALDAPG
jgi:hypothetical protein